MAWGLTTALMMQIMSLPNYYPHLRSQRPPLNDLAARVGNDADKPDKPVHIADPVNHIGPYFVFCLSSHIYTIIFLLVVVTKVVYYPILVIFHKLCLYLGPQIYLQ